jgi:hypothetical protein
MAEAVSSRPPGAEARVRSLVNPRGIFGRQSGTGTGFPRVSRSSPVNFIPSGIYYQETDNSSNNNNSNSNNNNKLHHTFAQEALRSRCVLSVCCGVLLHKNLNHGMGFYGVAFPSKFSTFCLCKQ